MKLISLNSYYRAASKDAPMEDGYAINLPIKMFAVWDGVSGPYSKSNPGLNYGNLTGGQMVGRMISQNLSSSRINDVSEVIFDANLAVDKEHLKFGKNPEMWAVAGACVSACEIRDGGIKIVVIGDCFVLLKDKNGFRFLTNFDQAAWEFEQKADGYFTECKEKCGGNIGDAWDMYFQYFSDKQFFRANKNLGRGGHAMLNGDPTLPNCWSLWSFGESSGIDIVILGTDGLLPQSETEPNRRNTLETKLGEIYNSGGIPAIRDWRDSFPNQPHITGYPESTAVEIKLA